MAKLFVTDHAKTRLYQRFNVSETDNKEVYCGLVSKIQDPFQYTLIELQADGNEIREVQYKKKRVHLIYNPKAHIVITFLKPFVVRSTKEIIEQERRMDLRRKETKIKQEESRVFARIKQEIMAGNYVPSEEYQKKNTMLILDNERLKLILEDVRLDLYDAVVENDQLKESFVQKSFLMAVINLSKARKKLKKKHR